MREKLAAIEGQRGEFFATFKRFGTKPAYKGPPIKTLLLVDVRDRHGNVWCDHIWFVVGKQFAALDLQAGEQIAFSATIKRYTKGYRGYRDDDDLPPVTEDFKLAFPLHVRRVAETATPETLPLFAESWKVELRHAADSALT